jgi:hypothetical protein
VELDGVRNLEPKFGEPIIELNNTKDVFIENNNPVKGTGTFLDVKGKNSDDIVIKYNNFKNAAKAVNVEPDVNKSAVITE